MRSFGRVRSGWVNNVIFKTKLLSNMKRFFCFSFVIVLLCCGCNRIEQPSDTVNGGMTRILIGGDFAANDVMTIDVSPMSKATEEGNSFYAFSIDSVVVTGNGQNTFYPYAEGLFDKDHVKDLRVVLDAGHKYRIKCLIVSDGEDKLFVSEDNKVFEPVSRLSDGVAVSNSFSYSLSTRTLIPDSQKVACVVSGNRSQKNVFSMLNVYYGEALVEGNIKDVVVNVQRRNFGVHVIIKAPTEGGLLLSADVGEDPDNASIQYETLDNFRFLLTSTSGDVDKVFVYFGNYASSDTSSYLNDRGIINFKPYVYWAPEMSDQGEFSYSENSFFWQTDGLLEIKNKTIALIKVDINGRFANSGIGIIVDDEMEETNLMEVK